MPLTETNPLPRFKTDCEPLARKLCKRARAPDLDLEVRRRAYRRGTFIVPVRRGVPVMPVWRGTLVVPAESGWIIKHDPADPTSGSLQGINRRGVLVTPGETRRIIQGCATDPTSGSLQTTDLTSRSLRERNATSRSLREADPTSGSVRRMEVRLALETVGLVKRSWFFCQKELSSLFALTKV